jgi:hypothetical protein
LAKRTLAQVIILENLQRARMDVQGVLLEVCYVLKGLIVQVMRERKLVTDFGAYSTPREFLVVCVLPPGERLWNYLVFPRLSSVFRMV